MKHRFLGRVLGSTSIGVTTLAALFASSAAAQGQVTLTYLASQDWVQSAELELGKKFQEETGIAIDYQIIPSDQYFNVLKTKLNSGEAPDILAGRAG